MGRRLNRVSARVALVGLMGAAVACVPEAPTPPPVAVAVSAGADHACALMSNGTVRCWGNNDQGQLGDGTLTASSTPVEVLGLTSAKGLVSGAYHSCVIAADNSIRCWGDNATGQLGNGTINDAATPVAVISITNAVQLSAGFGHTCALLSDTTARCWGVNNLGQLGNGSTAASPLPVQVSNITDAEQIQSGSSHTCVRLAAGTVQCWGRNNQHQLGFGVPGASSSTPITVPGITGAVDITGGNTHSCALTAAGFAKCWGGDNSGQLGDGSVLGLSTTPVNVVGLSGGVRLSGRSGSGSHTCSIVEFGAIKCWGSNFYGQLGNSSSGTSIPNAESVVNILNAEAVTAGGDFTCALIQGNAVQCWGHNLDGRLGNGTAIDSSVPVDVDGLGPAA